MKQRDVCIGNRTKGSAGFTLTEMLAAVLLMSLTTLAVAAGITAAVRTYREMTLKAEAQTLLGTAVAAIDDDFASADLSTLSIGDSGSGVSFFSGNRGYLVHIHNDGDTIYVTDKTNSTSEPDADSGTASADGAGAIPLVTARTRTLNLQLRISDISITPAQSGDVQESNPYFTYTISVYKDQKEIESETVNTAVIAGYSSE